MTPAEIAALKSAYRAVEAIHRDDETEEVYAAIEKIEEFILALMPKQVMTDFVCMDR